MKQTSRYLRNLEKGMDGETEVIRRLKYLPKDKFCVLSDFVDGNKGNVDIVVVGETGIWVIEVKNIKAGKITYRPNGSLYNDDFPINNKNGKNVLAQVHAEANNLQAYLLKTMSINIPINRIIVFSNPKSEIHFWDKPIDRTFIIRPPLLLDIIQKASIDKNLTPELCKKISGDIKQNTSILG